MQNILLSLRQAAADVIYGSPQGMGRAKAFEPFESAGVIVRCHVDWPVDDELLLEWDALSQCAPGGTPMHSPAWQGAAFYTSGAKRLRLITVHQDKLLAVLPMQLSPAGGLGTIGPWMSDYLDPLVKAGAGPRVWEAVLGFIASQWDRRINDVVLHNIREGAEVRRDLPTAAAMHGFTCEESVIDQAPVIELPSTWDAYLASLDAHERKETRRKLKKAQEQGGAVLERATLVNAPAALRTAVRLMEHAEGQKSKAVRQFLHPLLLAAGPALIAGDRLDVLTLRIKGEAAGSLVQFPTPTGPMLYNSGFDPGMREWSPGVVAVAMAIREAIAKGAAMYDLLRGGEAYKYRFGAVDRAVYRLTLRRK